MYANDDAAEHQAVTRLFELACNGETDNCEYSQLDSMVYERLRQAYAVTKAPQLWTRTAD